MISGEPISREPYILINMESTLKILSMEVTTRCSQSCRGCFALRDSGRERHLSRETAWQILEEGRALDFTCLHITGGEALMYPDLFDLLDEAVRLGYTSFFINTNGHFLTPETARRLAAIPGAEFSLSLDGNEELHDDRRGEGSYRKAIQGLEAALEAGLVMNVFTVASRDNLEALPRMTAALFLQYPGVNTQTFIQLRGGPEAEERKLGAQDFITLVQTVSLLGLAGYPVQILENPLSTVVAKRLGYYHLPPSPPISRDGKIFILASGELTENHSSSLRLSTWRPGTLAEVLRSPDYRRAVEGDREICPQCRYQKTCSDSGLIRPSDGDHNTGDGTEYFCRKVMDLV